MIAHSAYNKTVVEVNNSILWNSKEIKFKDMYKFYFIRTLLYGGKIFSSNFRMIKLTLLSVTISTVVKTCEFHTCKDENSRHSSALEIVKFFEKWPKPNSYVGPRWSCM